jgi:hypothetical protein
VKEWVERSKRKRLRLNKWKD